MLREQHLHRTMATKDIRGFFFGGKPAAAPAAAAPPKAPAAKAVVVDDSLLQDSDEEEQTKQRKRLKTTKQAAASPMKRKAEEITVLTSPSPRKSGRLELASPVKAKVASPPPAVVAEKPVPPILPVLGANPTSSPVKIVREVKGGASAFFGAGPSLPAPAPAPAAAVQVKSPVRSPAASVATVKSPVRAPAASAAAIKSPPSAGAKRKAAASAANAAAATAAAESSPTTASNSGMCFDGLKIAVTGVFDSASREAMEDLILSNGGKLAAAVSGKTSYLLSGVVLEDGRPASESSKHRAAVEKKVPILSETEFLDRIAAHQTKLAEAAAASSESQSSAAAYTTGESQSQSQSQSQAWAKSSAPAGNPFAAAGIAPNPFASSSSSNSGAIQRAPSTLLASRPSTSAASAQAAADMLWVDKYRPQSSASMIGSTELVNKLTAWLKRWDAVHLRKTEKVPFSKENPGARAVLLSGPPGIGKSTVSALAAKEGGYDVLELNASDTRNRKEIEAQLSNAVTCQAISSGGEVLQRKRLVIMDEVDGMGGSDRGGIAELIKVIKSSRIPIICICNDRQSQKIRSLVNHCYDLKVRRPTKQQIAQRLVAIAKGEGMLMEQNAAEMLVEQVGNDIRQALNSMQIWRSSSKSMNYTDVKAGMQRIEKDKILRLSPFDACGTILGGSKTPFQDRYESFFIDYALSPLLIQQNYIDAAKGGIFRNPQLDDVARMEMLSRASDAVSDSDLAAAAIRGQNMHWELLTTQAVFCVRAGAFVQGFQAFPGFPAWLGKNSSASKMSRMTKEIVHHTALTIGQGFQPIRLDYVPYLRQSLLHSLQRAQAGDAEVGEVVAALDAYGLTKEDFAENMKELQFVLEGDKVLVDHFAGLDTKVKTALTKAYNSTAHTSQVLVSELAVKAKKGRARGGGGDGDDDEDLDMGEEAREERALLAAEEDEKEDDDDGDISALVSKAKKPAAGKKAAAGAAGGATAKGKAKAPAKGK